jgi:hypothetical protein
LQATNLVVGEGEKNLQQFFDEWPQQMSNRMKSLLQEWM